MVPEGMELANAEITRLVEELNQIAKKHDVIIYASALGSHWHMHVHKTTSRLLDIDYYTPVPMRPKKPDEL